MQRIRDLHGMVGANLILDDDRVTVCDTEGTYPLFQHRIGICHVKDGDALSGCGFDAAGDDFCGVAEVGKILSDAVNENSVMCLRCVQPLHMVLCSVCASEITRRTDQRDAAGEQCKGPVVGLTVTAGTELGCACHQVQISCRITAVAVQRDKTCIGEGIGIGRLGGKTVAADECFGRQEDIKQMEGEQNLSGQLLVVTACVIEICDVGIDTERILCKETGPLR